MAVSIPNLSIITLNVNDLNMSIKDRGWQSGLKNMTEYTLCMRNSFQRV